MGYEIGSGDNAYSESVMGSRYLVHHDAKHVTTLQEHCLVQLVYSNDRNRKRLLELGRHIAVPPPPAAADANDDDEDDEDNATTDAAGDCRDRDALA